MKLILFAFFLIANLFVMQNAFGQIALRGTATNGTTSGNTLTVPKPSGIALNDLMIVTIAQSNNNSNSMAAATRSGWTSQIDGVYGSSGSDRWRITILYKVADATDAAAGTTSYAFTVNSSSDNAEGSMIAFSGVNTSNPFDVTSTTNTATGNPITAGTLTTVTPNAAILMIAGIGDNVNVNAWNSTSPGTLTELFDDDYNADVDMGIAAAWAVKATTGATGNGTGTLNNNEIYGGVLMALRPVTITTSTINGSPFCAGNAVSVPYTITGPYTTGNVFTAQLSNASGSFASPTTIGSVTSTAAGTISATIPSGQASGTGYRIRVVSSVPAATGSANATNITINAIPTSVAGTAVTMCASAGSVNVTAGASATNSSGVTWTSNGSGTFANANSLTLATYTPSAADITAGNVTINLVVNGNAPCSGVSSSKVLTISKQPTASAGGSTMICQNQTATVSGAAATNGTINWTSNGSGTISNPTTLTPTYNPVAADAGHTVIMTMTVSNAPCSDATATYSVVVAPLATAVAGTAPAMCESAGSINITGGASASNNTGITWTSSGTGTMANPNSISLATYTPSAADITAGSVTITLTATGISPCSNAVSNKTLTISKQPTASAGGSQTICTTQTATVSGASASNGTISWTENGAGSITSGGTTLTPTYTPAAGDAGNDITLTLTVTNNPCTAATATYTVHVNGAATADAGSSFPTCETAGAINITGGASATNNAGVTWTSDGTGTFTNANSLTLATYEPSAADIAAGVVVLTLTATGNTPCANATSNKNLFIRKQPTASAGGSATICQNQTATVSGASYTNGTISWTENGAGTITSGANTLTPTYTAAAGDAGHTVTLTMTVNNGPCTDATASYTVNVLALPTAAAGANFSTCANAGAVNVASGSSASNAASVAWTSSGTGIFTDADSLTLATYTPSAADITAGSVTLTLTAFGNGSCANATSTKTLTILPVPVTTGVAICQGSASSAMTSSVCADGAPVSVSEFPSSGTTTGSGTAWTSPANVSSDNNSNATVSGTVGFATSNTTSQTLVASNFGFAIPANAIILGVQATIGRYRSGSALSGEIMDNSVRLRKAGVDVGNNFGTGGGWPTSETVATYGAANNLWGTTWSASDINSSNFGLGLIVNISVFLGTRTANVDYVNLTVTYKLPGELNWYTVSSGGSAIATGTSFNPVGASGSGLADTNTPGTYTYYAECSTVAGCRTPTTFVINALPTVSFSGFSGTPYCEDAASVALAANQPGGTFSGAGITDNGDGTASFNPATAGVGPHVITYSYTDGNTCANTTTQTVNVNANATYYADADSDGFGDLATPLVSCLGAPAGFVSDSTDCNDADGTKHTTFPFYTDADLDGFGTGSLVSVCAVDANTPPSGYSLNNTDCDDNNAAMNQTFPFYVDADGDTFGTGSAVNLCAVDAHTPPTAGYAINDTDCNDADNTMHQTFVFYTDADGDGYGAESAVNLCAADANTVPTAGYSVNNTDCDDTKAAVNPGAVEIGYNLIDDNCDGQIDEGFPPKVTNMQSALCDTTLASIDSQIVANLVAGAQGYRWRITTMTGPNTGQVQFLDTALRTMKLIQLPSYAFATTYKVEVAVYYAGFLQPFTPSNCTVNTPSPSTQLSVCGLNMTTMSDVIYANIAPFVSGYRFRITDPINPLNTQVIDRPIREFRMNLVTAFVVQFGKAYNVEVALKNTDGSYLPYGGVCSVTTPVFPTTSMVDAQCDNYEVPDTTTQIYAYSYPSAIAYVFKITGPGLPVGGAEITRSLRAFSLSEFAGIVPGATYNVSVRLVFNNTDPLGPFGKVCTIVAPGLSRPEMPAAAKFNAVAYPNPFADNFGIDVTTAAAKEIVTIKVYDMTGRLLETRNVSVSDMDTVKVGDNYPSGVYNVIVSQGTDVKTLRVIKR